MQQRVGLAHKRLQSAQSHRELRLRHPLPRLPQPRVANPLTAPIVRSTEHQRHSSMLLLHLCHSTAHYPPKSRVPLLPSHCQYLHALNADLIPPSPPPASHVPAIQYIRVRGRQFCFTRYHTPHCCLHPLHLLRRCMREFQSVQRLRKQHYIAQVQRGRQCHLPSREHLRCITHFHREPVQHIFDIPLSILDHAQIPPVLGCCLLRYRCRW